MQLTCPSCSTTLDESHINEELDIVTCDNCHALFSLPSSRVSSPEDREAYYKSINLPVPLGYAISADNNQLSIELYDSYAHEEESDVGCFFLPILLLFICPFSVIMETSESISESAFWILSLIVVLSVGAVIWFSVNKKSVYAKQDVLKVLNSSLIFSDKYIEGNKIEQFYVIEAKSRSRRGNHPYYSLMLLTRSGKRIELLNRIVTMSAAIYFEKRLEEFFGIDDQAMKRMMP
ncbi:MAG: hypothetical protein AAF846_22585 [Chloroflexota bacterium]